MNREAQPAFASCCRWPPHVPSRRAAPTIRQQMAADLMGRVLPGRNRRQLEALLGPSLAAPYFRSTGRDLLYLLGPERKSIAIDSE